MKMNSSDSECFESADEDFELGTAHKSIEKPVPHILTEPPNIQKLEIIGNNVKEDSKSDPDDGVQKPEKRKPKSKLGTKLPKSTTISNKELEKSKFVIDNKDIKEVLPVEDNEPNLWDDDDWETTPISVQPQKESNSSDSNTSWSTWGTWGVSSLLSTATSITSQVSQGISTVLENGIGAPDPVSLAKRDCGDNSEPTNESTNDPIFGIGNLLSGVTQITKLVETTGSKVISGGLDTLETIGKKTMEVLQEGDPGFKKKRAFLRIDSNQPVLSQMLREGKEKTEQLNKMLEQRHVARQANYELLFDDHQGLVHLEALEMISKQCDIKLQIILESKSGSELVEMEETLAQIKELCEVNDDTEEDPVCEYEETEEKLQEFIAEMNISISYDKLIQIWKDAESLFNNGNLIVCNENELHEQAIHTLAQLTAISVEQFHKIGELLLIKEHRSTVDEADSLVQITMLLRNLLNYVAKKLCDKLKEKGSSAKSHEKVRNLITNIYIQAANSSIYVRNAFELLIPVLQVGAV